MCEFTHKIIHTPVVLHLYQFQHFSMLIDYISLMSSCSTHISQSLNIYIFYFPFNSDSIILHEWNLICILCVFLKTNNCFDIHFMFVLFSHYKAFIHLSTGCYLCCFHILDFPRKATHYEDLHEVFAY